MLPVSIIVPCYNEETTIRLLLDAIYCQTYPRPAMEVVIADGMSTDRTREIIAAFQTDHSDLPVRVVDNLKRNIPAGLNRALEAARGEIIVRLDAHSVPQVDYVERCVKAIESKQGEVVGGVWDIRPGGNGWIARSIAAVAAHPLGVGDARYRYTSQAAAVDTVPFGAYRRSLVDRIGPYDESLLTNEDYEFNTRARKSGGVVWLDPDIRTIYFARSGLVPLARQYWRYGYWKYRMLRRYPSTLRWRQALPPAFVLGLIGLALLSIFWALARLGLIIVIGIYISILIAAGIHTAWRRRDPALALGLPLGIATMHLSWGTGFLWSVLNRGDETGTRLDS